ncbi:MAG: DNA polymerase III subunit chi [Alphaproteobacteria bacterium]|nr:DNA polymerase III subunit chi [Alphaproteobacteria bacterium]
MTEVGFYHLISKPLGRALGELLAKALERDMRAVVLAGSPERVQALDGLLWTQDPGSFLPHGTATDGHAADQPIWLTANDENPNGARLLVLIDDMTSAAMGGYERAVYLFDGNDPGAVQAARARWSEFKTAGHAVTYWQQSESGGWEKKG